MWVRLLKTLGFELGSESRLLGATACCMGMKSHREEGEIGFRIVGQFERMRVQAQAFFNRVCAEGILHFNFQRLRHPCPRAHLGFRV